MFLYFFSFLFFIFPSFSSFHPEVVCPVKWSPHSTCSDHLTIKQWLPGSEALQTEFQNLGDKETGNFQIISQPMNKRHYELELIAIYFKIYPWVTFVIYRKISKQAHHPHTISNLQKISLDIPYALVNY